VVDRLDAAKWDVEALGVRAFRGIGDQIELYRITAT
jgi:hypothetical protein